MGKDIKELLPNFFTAVTHKLIILPYSLRLHYIRDIQTFIKMQFLLLLKTSSIYMITNQAFSNMVLQNTFPIDLALCDTAIGFVTV